jgi:hypothetical protein
MRRLVNQLLRRQCSSPPTTAPVDDEAERRERERLDKERRLLQHERRLSALEEMADVAKDRDGSS